MVINRDSTEIVFLHRELEIGMGRESFENFDGLGSDFGTYIRGQL